MEKLFILTELRIRCDRLYDGIAPTFLHDQLVIIKDRVIADIRPFSATDAMPDMLHVATATPGMIDMQINGAADAQFNFDPCVETLKSMSHGARQGGTAYILPTFITAPQQDYLKAIDAARLAIDSGVKGLLGVHLEGPFLSPKRPGIHTPSFIRPLDETDVEALEKQATDFPGIILLTLAPECQKPQLLKRLAASGIVLFAGHSEASAADMEWMQGVTHLWNAMPAPTSRIEGIVSEVLGGNRLFAGIITDGFHVGKQALSLSVRAASDRLCLVTDAMMTLAGKSTGFTIDGREISLADGRLTGADGTLAGAHIAMDASLIKLIELTGTDEITAIQMATRNPARALGLENKLGSIRIDQNASLSLFDDNLSAIGVVTDGQLFMSDNRY